MKPEIFTVSASSGSGKTTLIEELRKKHCNFLFGISCTTRLPREGEVNGKDYHFLSNTEFDEKIQNGEFLEYQEVYKNEEKGISIRYGTLWSEIIRIRRTECPKTPGYSYIPILDIDVLGALKVKERFGEAAHSVFISPGKADIKTIQNSLKKRLTKRGESEESIAVRLARVPIEMNYQDEFDAVIINDDLDVGKASFVTHVAKIFQLEK